MTEYKVITNGSPNEVWATGFYDEYGRAKAEQMVADGYWHLLMYQADKHKQLVVVPVVKKGRP